jgi:hypothetical protein
VSSILDALEKLERTRPPTLEPAAAAVPVPRRTRVFALVGTAFAAGAALALALLRTHPGGGPTVVAPPAEPRPPQQPAAEPVAPAPQAAPPPQSDQQVPAASPSAPQTATVPTPPNESAPSAQPEAPAPAASRAEVAAAALTARAPDAAHPPTPDALAAAPPVPAPSPTGPRPWASTVPPPPPPTAAEVAAPREVPAQTYAHLEPPAIRRPPAGAPAIRLSFLLYSPAPGRRTVALAIENRGLETLHEGESSADGVEVVRILPDRVELGWNGEHFTVRARD